MVRRPAATKPWAKTDDGWRVVDAAEGAAVAAGAAAGGGAVAAGATAGEPAVTEQAVVGAVVAAEPPAAVAAGPPATVAAGPPGAVAAGRPEAVAAGRPAAVAAGPRAAAVAAERPAAVAAGTVVFDTSAFGARRWSGSCKQHNAALKWFRLMQEGADPEAAQPLVFNNTEHVAVAAIVKGKGMDYDFDRTQMVSWSWWEMVAQMEAESINVVCHGPENRSRGLVGCQFSPRPQSYDHKRHHQLKHAQQHYGNPQLRFGTSC